MTDQMRKMLDELMGTQRDGKKVSFAFTKNAGMSSLCLVLVPWPECNVSSNVFSQEKTSFLKK